TGNCASWNNGNVVDAGGACTTGGGGGTVSAGLANQIAYYAGAGTTVGGLATCNNGVYLTSNSGVPSCGTTLPSAVQANITATGALASGSLASGFTPVTGALGGTGVNNGSNTITLAGANLALAGGYNVTLTASAATNATLPAGTVNLTSPILLATLTASTSASLTDINNCAPISTSTTGCFTNAYTRYLIDLENLVLSSPTGNGGCQIQVYNSGGTYQATGYIAQYNVDGTVAGATTTTYISCSPVGIGSGTNTLGAPGVSGWFIIYNPAAAAKAQMLVQTVYNVGTTGAPVTHTNTATGYWNTAQAIVGFRICPGTTAGTCAGTWATGVVKVYGLP
ncbi:MAG TPA: hypothetical protein VMU34_01430, partial [Mycobacterium sp.]|nr:hypothetical protein [Mycobacterium sp.]